MSALGKCVAALAQSDFTAGAGKVHVPTRDSKLTRLLSTHLSGSSRIALLAAVAPLKSHPLEGLVLRS